MTASIPNFSNPLQPSAGPSGVNLGRIAVNRVEGGDVVSALERAIPALTGATRKVVQEHRAERVRTIETFLNSETGVQFTQGLRNAKDDATREAMFQGAVEDGLLPASDSPYFRHVWNKREAIRAGQVLQGRLNDAIVTQQRTSPKIDEETQEIIPGEDFETVFQDVISGFDGNSALSTEVGSEVWLTEAARWKQAYSTESNKQATTALETRQTQLITSGFSASLAELNISDEKGGETARSWVADFSSLSDGAQEATIRMIAREIADYEKTFPGKGRDAFAKLMEVEGVNGIPLGDPRNAGLIDMFNRIEASLEAAENSSAARGLRNQSGREQDGAEIGSAVAAGTLSMTEAVQAMLEKRKDQGDTIRPEYAETLINRGVTSARNSAVLGETASASKREALINELTEASGQGEIARIIASGRDLTADDKDVLAGYAEERTGYIQRGVHQKITQYERQAIPQAESIGFELPTYEQFAEMKPQEMQRTLDRVKRKYNETRRVMLNVGLASGYSGLPGVDTASYPKGVPQHSPLYTEAVEMRDNAARDRERYVSDVLREISSRYDPLDAQEKVTEFQTLLNDRSSGFARREDLRTTFDRDMRETVFGDRLGTVARDEDVTVTQQEEYNRLGVDVQDLATALAPESPGEFLMTNKARADGALVGTLSRTGGKVANISSSNTKGDISRAVILGRYAGTISDIDPQFENKLVETNNFLWMEVSTSESAGARNLLKNAPQKIPGAPADLSSKGNQDLLKLAATSGLIHWTEAVKGKVKVRATGVRNTETSFMKTPRNRSFTVPAFTVDLSPEVLQSIQLDAAPMYSDLADVEKAFMDEEYIQLLTETYKATGAESPERMIDRLKAKMMDYYAE